MTQKRRRPTQAERSAATRQVLLDAAIHCLYQYGYGSTTTIIVAEAAQVSRGAMLHQFPSKADLMAYVVETVFEADIDVYRELLAGVDDPRDRVIAYPSAVWKVLSKPSGVAVMEIMLGSRSDPALAERLAPINVKNEKTAVATLQRELAHRPSLALLNLIVGAVRGLSIMQVIATEDDDVEASIQLLQKLINAGIEAGILETGPSAAKSKPKQAARSSKPRASKEPA